MALQGAGGDRAGLSGHREGALESLIPRARRYLYGVGLFSAVINILALTGSLFMLQIYDRVLPSGSVQTLVVLSLLAATLFAFFGLLDFFRGRVLVRLGSWFDAAISPIVYRTVVQLPLTNAPNKGDPLRDLDAVRSFLSGPGPGVLFDLPWVPFYLGLIYLFHPWLAGLALVGMVLLAGVMLITEVLTRRPTKLASAHAAERQKLAETSRRNTDALSAMGMVARYGERWTKVNELYMVAQQRASDVAGSFGALSRSLRMMLQSAVLALGAYLVIQQEATAGIIIAGAILTGRALAPLDMAIPNWKHWVAARQSWKTLSQTLDAVPERSRLLSLRRPRQQLSAVAASAMPPGTNKVVVRDASFTLNKGHGLGIIGPSASGKSSLARLLVGVWQPVRGKIELDGAALDQWSPEARGHYIGYLPQAVELLPGTVSENIARFDPDPNPDTVIRAAEAAGVHDLIVGLSEGYQTLIGEKGEGLSAGQQQRIALARALYGEPFLVVLDEPNSNLDGEGQAALAEAIRGVRQRGGIAVVITHLPGILATVDTLLVMGNGRIQLIGPKDEILSQVYRPAKVAPPPLKVVGDTKGSNS